MKADSFCGYAWNKLYHMDIIKEHNLTFDEELSSRQDLLFSYQYIAKCKKISYSDKPSYHYNIESGVHSNKTKLNPRKLAGLEVYDKIITETKDEYPDIAKMSYISMFKLSLQYLYQYYSDERFSEALPVIKSKMKKSRKVYLLSPKVSFSNKIFAILGLLNGKLYYKIRYKYRTIKHKDDKSYGIKI
jgi:uncharacterized short protein YbdD (DUF466 family)